MGHSTEEISKVKAQTTIHACGTEINEASQPYDLGTSMIQRLITYPICDEPKTPLQKSCKHLWSQVKSCELGDNHKMYITFKNEDFIVIDLK